jgi:MtN3 and saliva related transmembrane protein
MITTDFIIGLLAGLLCTVSFLPQVIKAFKTRRTKDLSLATFSILSAGLFLWIIYGILINQIPIILTNVMILVLSLLILGMKLKYG